MLLSSTHTRNPEPKTQNPAPRTQDAEPSTQHPEPLRCREDYTVRAAAGAVNPISCSTSAIFARLASPGGSMGRR
jgi:hypothetical protein